MPAENADPDLLEDLWARLLREEELITGDRVLGSDPSFHYDVLALSRAIFGSTEAAKLYATHRMLRKDRLFFFRLKTRPPTFHARPADEVDALRHQHKLVRLVHHPDELASYTRVSPEHALERRRRCLWQAQLHTA